MSFLKGLLVVAMLANFSVAFGQDVIKTPEQIRAERNMAEARTNYTREREIALGQKAQAERDLAAARGPVEALTRDLAEKRRRLPGTATTRFLDQFGIPDKDRVESEKEVAAAKARLEAAEVAIQAASRRIVAAGLTLNNLESRQAFQQAAVQDTIASQQERVRTLEGQIRRLDDFSDFSNTRLEIADMGIKLAALERVLDKSAVGEYMRSKFSDLLSSNVLCEAAKACAEGKKPSIGRDKVDREIFPAPRAAAAPAGAQGGRGNR